MINKTKRQKGFIKTVLKDDAWTLQEDNYWKEKNEHKIKRIWNKYHKRW